MILSSCVYRPLCTSVKHLNKFSYQTFINGHIVKFEQSKNVIYYKANVKFSKGNIILLPAEMNFLNILGQIS